VDSSPALANFAVSPVTRLVEFPMSHRSHDLIASLTAPVTEAVMIGDGDEWLQKTMEHLGMIMNQGLKGKNTGFHASVVGRALQEVPRSGKVDNAAVNIVGWDNMEAHFQSVATGRKYFL
jgi:hypothetical protein